MLRRKVEGHEKTGQDSWPVCLGFVGLLGFSFDVLDSISVAVLHPLYPLIITPCAWVHRVVRLLQAILDTAGNSFRIKRRHSTTSGSTVRPSAFSSFVANGFRCSAGPAKSGKATGKFLTRDQCKSLVVTTTMYFKYKYHSHSEGWNGCGFVKPSVRFSGCSTDNPKLDWIIRTLNPQNDRDRLGLYCAMAYMAAKYYGDAECFITEANCRTIWKNNGVWTVGGVQRDLAWTLAYFNQVYGANAFDACLKGA